MDAGFLIEDIAYRKDIVRAAKQNQNTESSWDGGNGGRSRDINEDTVMVGLTREGRTGLVAGDL